MCNQKDELTAEAAKYEQRIETLENSIKDLDRQIEETDLIKQKVLYLFPL